MEMGNDSLGVLYTYVYVKQDTWFFKNYSL